MHLLVWYAALALARPLLQLHAEGENLLMTAKRFVQVEPVEEEEEGQFLGSYS